MVILMDSKRNQAVKTAWVGFPPRSEETRLLTFPCFSGERNGKWVGKWEELMLELVRKCRSRGINLIISQQRGTVNQISRAIASNLQGRICLKVSDKYNSIACIGQSGGELLLGKGDLLAKTKTELFGLRSPYITPSCWKQIVNTVN